MDVVANWPWLKAALMTGLKESLKKYKKTESSKKKKKKKHKRKIETWIRSCHANIDLMRNFRSKEQRACKRGNYQSSVRINNFPELEKKLQSLDLESRPSAKQDEL